MIMLELRKYQNESVDSVLNHINKMSTHPLVELPTGTGKSLVIADICRRILFFNRLARILVLAHVKELVQQNHDELRDLCPDISTGIYAAGLGQKQARSSVTFGSIQSCAKNAWKLVPIDLVLVDEAHMIPGASTGQYRTLLAELKKHNPHMQVVGLTATPYRLSSGRLDDGPDRLFDRIVYRYEFARAVKEGYLAPLISKRTAMQIDLSGVKIRGGEYVESELQAAVDQDDITRRAVDEIIAWGETRRSCLIFGSGIDHCDHVAAVLREKGQTAESVSSAVSPERRAELLADFKAGKIKYLVNPNILTTGFNAKNVDMIVMLRGTMSIALYVQMLGRGTRCIGKNIEESIANGKANCLVLDFVGNIARHGPIDAIDPPKRGQKKATAGNQAMARACPNCDSMMHISKRICDDCGYEWPRSDEVKHSDSADAVSAVMSSEIEDEWHEVRSMDVAIHKKNGAEMLMITYWIGQQRVRTFVTPLHDGYPGERSRSWMRAMGVLHLADGHNTLPTPDDVIRAIKKATHIQIAQRGQYLNVKRWYLPDDELVIDEQGRGYAAKMESDQ